MDKLWQRAKEIIPGGNCLYSKRPEYYSPNKYPAYYSKCKGVEVWDLDGNKLTDMSTCGIGACTLGYADPDVDRAVLDAVKSGSMCTLNVPEEVELAELLLKLHPWADMVKFARTGGEAMVIAVQIARKYTGKEGVACTGYHGWHLEDLKKTTPPRKDVATVIVEPDKLPKEAEYCPDTLILDEITTGMRVTTGGMHLTQKIKPDMAVFAKAMSNGYPFACVIGTKEVMSAAEDTFISSTYWTEKIGTVAALATIKKHKQLNVPAYLKKIGTMVQKGWKEIGKIHGLDIKVSGIPALSHWEIQHGNSKLMHTIIVEKMLECGFLTSNQFYPTYTHTEEHVENYLNILTSVLGCDIIKKLRDTTVAEEKPI